MWCNVLSSVHCGVQVVLSSLSSPRGEALMARLVAVSRTGCRATLRGRRGTWWHWRSICVAGVALGDIYLRLAWQVWHLLHLAGSGGALGLRWWPWAPRHFAWQAWHLVTLTFHLRGRRGSCSHELSFSVAGVALGDIDVPFAWQGWRLLRLAGSGGALGLRWWPWAPRHFAWQAWHLVTLTFHLRGRRGSCLHELSFCVAGVALGDIHLHFAWHVWRLWHWAGSDSGGALGRR